MEQIRFQRLKLRWEITGSANALWVWSPGGLIALLRPLPFLSLTQNMHLPLQNILHCPRQTSITSSQNVPTTRKTASPISVSTLSAPPAVESSTTVATKWSWSSAYETRNPIFPPHGSTASQQQPKQRNRRKFAHSKSE